MSSKATASNSSRPIPEISHPNAPAEPINGQVSEHNGLIQVEVVCRGATPLLMSSMSEQQLLDLWFKNKAPKTATRRKPREEAESKLHRMPDGRLHLPTRALYSCLVNAGQFIRLDGKRQISTADKTILPSMLSLLSQTIPLTMHDGETPATWEVDIMQGRNPNGGEAVCIIRPRLDEWQFAVSIEVDQSLMPLTMARELLDIAGRRIGLLDYNPRHRGTYGQFRVVQWQEVREKATA